MEDLDINVNRARADLVAFIVEQTRTAGFGNLVLGLSGGLDSSTVAFLAAEAMGKAHVTAVLMPYKSSLPSSETDAKHVVAQLGIESVTIPITAQIDAYFEQFPDATEMRRANKMARERMTILYDQSAVRDALVIGTSNKTEILLGYGTLYGDMACAFNPLAGLYKTQVRQLARGLGVPDNIVEKPPTADLWPGQTDEGELGFTYAEVDRLLFYVIDKAMTDDELLKQGFDLAFMDQIRQLIRRSRYKRRLPVVPRLST